MIFPCYLSTALSAPEISFRNTGFRVSTYRSYRTYKTYKFAFTAHPPQKGA